MGQAYSSIVHALANVQTRELLIAIAVPNILGQIVGLSTKDDVQVWYKTLNKPSWDPPAPIFGLVWGLLYTAMGAAACLVFHYGGGWPAQAKPLTWWAVQLGMNLMWPIVFFKRHKLGQALTLNLGVLAAAAFTAYKFYQVLPEAGNLMIPYVAWVAFANLLNYSIMKRNPLQEALIEPLRDEHPNPGENKWRPGGATASLAVPTSGVIAGRSRRSALLVQGSAKGLGVALPQPARAAFRAPPAMRGSVSAASRRVAAGAAVAGVRGSFAAARAF